MHAATGVPELQHLLPFPALLPSLQLPEQPPPPQQPLPLPPEQSAVAPVPALQLLVPRPQAELPLHCCLTPLPALLPLPWHQLRPVDAQLAQHGIYPPLPIL